MRGTRTPSIDKVLSVIERFVFAGRSCDRDQVCGPIAREKPPIRSKSVTSIGRRNSVPNDLNSFLKCGVFMCALEGRFILIDLEEDDLVVLLLRTMAKIRQHARLVLFDGGTHLAEGRQGLFLFRRDEFELGNLCHHFPGHVFGGARQPRESDRGQAGTSRAKRSPCQQSFIDCHYSPFF